MPRNHRARSILARAAAGVLYANKPDDKSGAGGDPPVDDKLELTPDELEAKLAEAREAAVKEDREKRKAAEKEKRKRERAAAGEDEDEDPVEVAKAAELRAAEAEQRAADAERKALMADVNVKLRDYLTANYKEFVANAQDIILHIERALPKDAGEGAIARLIESHAKAFVERTKAARGAAVNPSISRSKISGLEGRETRTITKTEPGTRPFAAINWHG